MNLPTRLVPVILLILVPLALLILAMLGGKSSDERLVDLAQSHAAREAESRKQMLELQKQVAEGSRRLVESDAKAREHLTEMQSAMRADQAEVGRQRDALKGERRELARSRYLDPIIAAAITDLGLTLACLLPLALGAYVIYSVRSQANSDEVLVEFLVQEVTADHPRLGRPSLSALDFEQAAVAASSRIGHEDDHP